jgi:hypothetical protein
MRRVLKFFLVIFMISSVVLTATALCFLVKLESTPVTQKMIKDDQARLLSRDHRDAG